MNSNQKMIIVGGGIAGLSTGCYAQMNGFSSNIFEMHTIPGGLCTAWKRKGYTFDISMHMVTGSKNGPLHQMWRELGVIQNHTFHYHDVAVRIENGEKCLSVYPDRDRLQEQMITLSPDDRKRTEKFVRLVTGKSMMNAMSLKPAEMARPGDKLKMMAALMPFLSTFLKYGNQTIQEFAQGFKDPFLRDAVRFIIDSPGWPMVSFPMVAMIGFMNSAVRDAGVPIGGSQSVVNHIADYYHQLGGEINYKSRVTELIIENDRAVGVILSDGTEHRADTIVWAADGHTLLFDILDERYRSDEVKTMYDEWIPVLPLVHVAIGVDRDLSNEPHRIVFKLDEPITIAGEEHQWMCFLHHCFDPTMAPSGKSAVEVWYATRYDYWQDLAKNRTDYENEKKRIADFTLAQLEKRWPGFTSQVQVVDVPTPVTYTRYTGNWQGSPDGWYITPDNMRKQTTAHSLPDLAGLHMVGQWTVPFSGTVMAALSGRQLVQLLCNQMGKVFVSSVA